jgi:hypothetical protein
MYHLGYDTAEEGMVDGREIAIRSSSSLLLHDPSGCSPGIIYSMNVIVVPVLSYQYISCILRIAGAHDLIYLVVIWKETSCVKPSATGPSPSADSLWAWSNFQLFILLREVDQMETRCRKR